MLQATFWGTCVIASPDIVVVDRLNYDQPTLQDVDKMKHTQSTYVQIRDIWQLAYAGMNRAITCWSIKIKWILTVETIL